ncbi:MAG: hypothetical protein ABWZ82_04430 [Candidatus Limnocylindrales bacterium]
MATWRCPHCDTPQADGARCWACSRHPLACGSCRNYIRAVAGRLGYCALDRTRAVLQGDEIRACWQAPSRPEPYEGLFRELEPEDPAGEVATRAPVTSSRDGDLVGTRTWAIPILPDRPGVTMGGASGLREATVVPARSAGHRSAAGAREPGSDDPELGGIGEHPAVLEGDPDGHQALISDRTLDETHL